MNTQLRDGQKNKGREESGIVRERRTVENDDGQASHQKAAKD